MLRFFRQIRQRLLTENRFSKYLLYAIGEILLVVIGILLALQIDTWNQDSKNRDLIISLLNEIREDLKTDIAIFRENTLHYKDRIAALEWGLSKTDYTLSQNDSLSVFVTTDYKDNKLSDLGFNKLQSSGITEFFEFTPLVNELKKFYLVKGTQFNIWVDWDKYWSTQELLWKINLATPYEWSYSLFGNFEFPSIRTEQENFDDKLKMLKSPQFRNLKMDDLRRKRTLKLQFENFEEEAADLVGKIDAQIQNINAKN